mmetsp:Transcript_27348/g.72162  ORF Transcript_27348/g.72162 Transcript_27348/m.72162 type:complete len:104 (-) Transcript_27348:488-799(-)
MCDICVTSDPVRVIDLTQYANKALPKRELVVFPDEEIENGADDEEGWDEDECSDDDNNKVSDDSWRGVFSWFGCTLPPILLHAFYCTLQYLLSSRNHLDAFIG